MADPEHVAELERALASWKQKSTNPIYKRLAGAMIAKQIKQLESQLRQEQKNDSTGGAN